jgi:SAM-dependent methyltransferase
MPHDPLSELKTKQVEAWSFFTPIETFTTPPAAALVRFARIGRNHKVLDVGCGTGVVAITAARTGADVTGLDLTPKLLERAREHSRIAELGVLWKEGDAEQLPYPNGTFDVVVSQFGHMFAPRAEVATAEMLRVLKPGGTLAFATWPPEHFVGRFFAVVARYGPPPPPGVSAPASWGDVSIIRQRLGDAATDLKFERGIMRIHALSVPHFYQLLEETIGPLRALASSGNAEAIGKARAEILALAAEYYEDNSFRQDFLMTRARKV